MTPIPDDIMREAKEIIAAWLRDPRVTIGVKMTSGYKPDALIAHIARALLAERTRTQKETAERCILIAVEQAWEHGSRHFDGPELNSAAIASAIRAAFLEGKEG